MKLEAASSLMIFNLSTCFDDEIVSRLNDVFDLISDDKDADLATSSCLKTS